MSNTDEFVLAFRADLDLMTITCGGNELEVAVEIGTPGAEPACRCFRCGALLSARGVRRFRRGGYERPSCVPCGRVSGG